MNDFIVTIDEEKFVINTSDSRRVKVGDIEYKLDISQLSDHTYSLKLGNEIFQITTTKLGNNKYSFLIDGHYFESFVRTKLEEETENILKSNLNSNNEIKIISPMPGMILRVNKKVGDKVTKGESLILLEAMKMENELKATEDGIVSDILIEPGKSVEKNQILIITKK
jgi:biotin carboxyl carrier protein